MWRLPPAAAMDPADAPLEWTGLPLAALCLGRAGMLELPHPSLLWWRRGGAEIRQRQGVTRPWRVQAREGRFDLVPAGAYEVLGCVGDGAAALALLLPPDCGLPTGAACPARPQFSDPPLARLVMLLVQQQLLHQPYGALVTRGLSAAIVERLHAGTAASGGVFGREVRARLEALIDSRLDEPLPQAVLAAVAGQAPAAFGQAFRSSFGTTPHQYLLERRVRRAACLLRDGAATLTTIAAELGFASHAHFSTAFRARVGMTPSDYRRLEGGDPGAQRGAASGQPRRAHSLMPPAA